MCVMNRGRRIGQRVVADVSTVRDRPLVAGARRRPSRTVTQEVAIEGRTRDGGVWGSGRRAKREGGLRFYKFWVYLVLYS